MTADGITPGFMLVQGNRTERLRELVVEWLRRYPLAPLEQEVMLVQSNGIAQWLKHSLAANRDAADPGCGIAAALEMSLPARLQWQAYRAVLGDLPETSPFDKLSLQWRLMRLLPALTETVFAPLQRFLQDDPDFRKRFQLAGKLADLFDQYQVYRAGWLKHWENGRDVLVKADGKEENITVDQGWQPALWRAVVADIKVDMPAELSMSSRATIHTRFLEQAKTLSANNRPKKWPRRIVVFGISSMPQQTLEVLAAMARCTQVLFCVHNPCKHYWGDIVEGRELFRSAYKRSSDSKQFMDKPAEQIHLESNPLLAAWGKQGRDYIRLLDVHDDRQSYEKLFTENQLNIDLFDEAEKNEQADTLLQQLQNDILELRPLSDRKNQQSVLQTDDDSLVFHVAHSPQREVEILHDQLLAAFEKNPELKPRDIMVMVPDINTYAPHIQAVFGQINRSDQRYIPFTIADQGQREQKPLLQALEKILQISQSRFAVSEMLDLLDVTAIRKRFGLEESSLPTLHAWVRDAQIRWGLHAAQRGTLGLPADDEQNTWLFGLRRMLLGYAVGSGAAWQDIEPFDEIGGLDAALVGQLVDFLDALEACWIEFDLPAIPEAWGMRLRKLLAVMFSADNADDAQLLAQLELRLDEWLQVCEQAGFDDEIPIAVVSEAWLSAIDKPQLSQRFLAGAVNFATLMPMRAIPFEHICLLGMNHGDFPRQQPAVDFDMMARKGHYQPGDRSRREDDRYLFLEALLSARKQFYVSWVGRSVKDNAHRPPSVLVGQLRDHLDTGWQSNKTTAEKKPVPVSDILTLQHPLQPFSRDYFSGDNKRLFTYASEWRLVHGNPAADLQQEQISKVPAEKPSAEKIQEWKIKLNDLVRFLKNPAQAYFSQVLKIWMDDSSKVLEDGEPFSFDGLQDWQLRNDLLQPLAASLRKDAGSYDPEVLQLAAEKLQRAGKLPHAVFGDIKSSSLQEDVDGQLLRYQQWLSDAVPEPAQAFELTAKTVTLSDALGDIYTKGNQSWRLVLTASNVGAGKKLKYYHVMKEWPAHLALCAEGKAVTTVIVHRGEEQVTIPVVSADVAREQLSELLRCYEEGMQAPLPVGCETAFAWLAGDKDDETAEEAYDGGYNKDGEVGKSAVLRRCWPDFHALQKSGAFPEWAEVLYEPLYQLMIQANNQELSA
jgi:exodeoxyribonuclease V gamma subunit